MSTRTHVSVVTPVYNGAEYLRECIESVLAQTHEDWDYTVVDNCSDDGSGAIAAEYAARDSRIRVVRNPEFLDMVSNINRAASMARPDCDWVKIVLADDWMFPRCLEQMVRVGVENPTAGMISSWRLEETRVTCDGLEYGRELFAGAEIARRSLRDGLFVFGSPSTILLRGDLVRAHDPFYAHGRVHEDTERCYELLLEHELGFVHEVLTFTRRQNESETAARNVFDAGHRLDRALAVSSFAERFFPAEEASALVEKTFLQYYRFLAERSLYRTGEEFWRYHREGLSTVGLELDRGRYRRELARAVWRQLTDPVKLLRRLRKVPARVRGPQGLGDSSSSSTTVRSS